MTNEMQLQLDNEQELRRKYLVSLKRFANLELPNKIRKLSGEKLEPAIAANLGRPLEQTSPEDREKLAEKLTEEPLYKAWGALTYGSQSMMWELVTDILAEDLPRLSGAAARLSESRPAGGSLELNPNIKPAKTISDTEIHRQPGGFTYESGDNDITAGAFYAGASLVYGPGKRANAPIGYGAGDFVVNQVRTRFPDFVPGKVLDIGCGAARNTLAYPAAFPDAEVHAIDVAPGLLRYAHAHAESAGACIHFHQMNAEAMDFEDESFDLVVSTIVGHETCAESLPKILRECWRILRPGGVVLHMDVPTQTTRLPLSDQVLNAWQVDHNGEPFWTSWMEIDMAAEMIAAGYPKDSVFAEHTRNGAVWYVHGARKPA